MAANAVFQAQLIGLAVKCKALPGIAKYRELTRHMDHQVARQMHQEAPPRPDKELRIPADYNGGAFLFPFSKVEPREIMTSRLWGIPPDGPTSKRWKQRPVRGGLSGASDSTGCPTLKEVVGGAPLESC